MKTENTMLVVVEIHEEGIHPLALEALQAGKLMAQAIQGRLAATVIGAGIGPAVERLRGLGIERIYVVDDPRLCSINCEYSAWAVAEVCRVVAPSYILMANTITAVDLAPRVAWQLEAGLVTDCVAIETPGSGPVFVKPVYSGNVMAVCSAATQPFIVTLRPHAFSPLKPNGAAQSEIVPFALVNAPATRVAFVERFEGQNQGIKLDTAERIVAGGRGIGGAEGFSQLQSLADVLSAAIGASRPPCDLGWVTPAAQIGQTGEIVAPGLYIAVGISGSMQHLAGMSGAKTIVAINKDPLAPIFRIADYGVAGKYEEVIPAFTDALKGMLT